MSPKKSHRKSGPGAVDVEVASETTPLLPRVQQPRAERRYRHLEIIGVLTVSIVGLLCFLASLWMTDVTEVDRLPKSRPNRPSSASRGPRIYFPYNGTVKPRVEMDFPDPSIIQAEDGLWYSFATNNYGKNVQVARALDPLGEWEVLDHDAMPEKSWTSGHNFWAPDVRRVGDGSYVLYYSGHRPQGKHCVGVARSRTIMGPYKPDSKPWECPLTIGGAIDPSGFEDPVTGRRYVVYKVDGNTLGHGGECNNMVQPQVPTPIMLQEVSAMDGTTKIGQPTVILDRTMHDGPLVEAPNLVRSVRDGRYLLFFSSHCFTNPAYDVKFAWADNIEGQDHQRRQQHHGRRDVDQDGRLWAPRAGRHDQHGGQVGEWRRRGAAAAWAVWTDEVHVRAAVPGGAVKGDR
jgi:hypothetical protein